MPDRNPTMAVIGTLVEIVYILMFYLTVHELQFRRRKKLKISAGLNPHTLDYQSYILPLPYLCLHVIECCLLSIWEGGGWKWVPEYKIQPSRKFLVAHISLDKRWPSVRISITQIFMIFPPGL
jgi:hypothetical protein